MGRNLLSAYSSVQLILCIAFTSLSAYAHSAVIISQANGNWSNTATWGGNPVPGNDDVVIISSGNTVNLNASLVSTSSLSQLTIQPGATLIVTVNSSTLRIKGDIINDGMLNLWQSGSLQADLVLYGDSEWSGSGTWNLSAINIQTYNLEFAPGLILDINESILAGAGGSLNKIAQRTDITFNFRGTANSNLPSEESQFYYADISVDKTAGTVSFNPSAASNLISFYGNLDLVKANDRLIINNNNTLTLKGSVTGLGDISGGAITSTLIVGNPVANAINPLRIASGTSFANFIVSRTAGAVLSHGFIIRDHLTLYNQSIITLPPTETLTLGVNGASPSLGILDGDGSLIGSSGSSMSIRGSYPLVTLQFSQSNSASYSLNNLNVDKIAGEVDLAPGNNLIVNGRLDIADNNLFSIGSGKLTLRSLAGFGASGFLKGSLNSSLAIEGNGTTSYSVQFDQTNSANRSLKNYSQSRNATITLANPLEIISQVNLTGTSSKLVSGGNLTLLSTPAENAAIGPLLSSADVSGDVNIQSYITGNGTNMLYRSVRALSSPVNDALISAGNDKIYQQLQKKIIITGPGGQANGFDQGGSGQPYAETLTYYNEPAIAGQSPFLPVTSIYDSNTPGLGFFAFFRGKQGGSYALNFSKLNAPYTPPDAVTLVYKGPINKYNITVANLRNSNHAGDVYNGYNLVGNPYPSSIDWTKIKAVSSPSLLDEVVIIKPGGGQASYINGISNNGGSPYIQAGQAFYVRTTTDGSSISFREDCKTSNQGARLLSAPGKSLTLAEGGIQDENDSLKDSLIIIRLNLKDDMSSDETTIVMKAGANPNATYEDAPYFSGSSVSLASLSADDKPMAINLLPLKADDHEVKLYVNSTAGGDLKIAFTELECLKTYQVYLKDNLIPGRLIDIKENPVYAFSIDKMNAQTFGANRFTLILKPLQMNAIKPVNAVNAILLYPNPCQSQLFVRVANSEKLVIKMAIYDILGKKIRENFYRNQAVLNQNVNDLDKGVYLVELFDTGSGALINKARFIKE